MDDEEYHSGGVERSRTNDGDIPDNCVGTERSGVAGNGGGKTGKSTAAGQMLAAGKSATKG